MQKNKLPILIPFFLLLILLGSCSIVGGIFKAGVWVGVIGIVIILIIIIWLVSKATKK
ncbi:MAG: phosphatidate cytidylyltransferase [Ginsengibacter sp.]